MDEERIEELARSIRANGIIQPIVVRKSASGYEIIAGERRWRAAQRAGLLKVPIVVRDMPDDRLLAVALIENIQREDLNPMEEAAAYRRLLDEFHLTQEQIADAVGKDRSSIANYVRLLRLPHEMRENVASGALAMGHARALLGLPDEAAQLRIARDVVARKLSVRETEVAGQRRRCEPATRTRGAAEGRAHARRRREAALLARHPRPHHAQGQGRKDRDRFRIRRRAAAALRAAYERQGSSIGSGLRVRLTRGCAGRWGPASEREGGSGDDIRREARERSDRSHVSGAGQWPRKRTCKGVRGTKSPIKKCD